MSLCSENNPLKENFSSLASTSSSTFRILFTAGINNIDTKATDIISGFEPKINFALKIPIIE